MLLLLLLLPPRRVPPWHAPSHCDWDFFRAPPGTRRGLRTG